MPLLRWLAAALSFALLLCVGSLNAHTADRAPLRIAVLVSSDKNRCYDPGTVKAIRHFTEIAAQEATEQLGRPVNVSILDDFEDAGATIANVKAALADPQTLALVGLSSSTRAKALFDALGADFFKAKIPFVSEVSLDSIFRQQPTVFSMVSTSENELLAIKRFVKDRGVTKPAFIGIAGDDYAMALGDGLKQSPDALALVADQRVPVTDNRMSDSDLDTLIDVIARERPDMLLLALQSGPGSQLVKRLAAAKLELPVFVLYGRIGRILTLAGVDRYPQDAFEIGREGIPNVTNERLRQRLWRQTESEWVFADTPNKSTPGWSNGRCFETKSDGPLAVLSDANRRAIGRGTQYADMVRLIGSTVARAGNGAGIDALRATLGEHFGKMSDGSVIERGLWQDWSFGADRSSADDPLILLRPAGTAALGLAPWQYHRIRSANSELQKNSVIYLTLDMIGLSRIDTTNQVFEAEFYLSLASDNAALGIESLEFTNAARSDATRAPLLDWREIKATSPNGVETGRAVKLYKVSGQFTMEPELAAYPFDTQRLSIAFQASSKATPFVIQPSPSPALSSLPDINGWSLIDRYFGSDQDIIPTVVGAGGQVRPVGYAKFNDTWIVKRHGHDFYLRVVLPLVFILLITYLSAFLTHDRFESIMGIQVTALLSAIALNLSQPVIGTNELSLSDRAFIVTYAAITLMSALSVLKDAVWVSDKGVVHRSIGLLQKFGYPIAVLGTLGWLLWAGIGSTLVG